MVATVDILIKHCAYVELTLVSTVAISPERGGTRKKGRRVKGGREGRRREGG